jgi:hypothetical protein
MNGYRDFLDTYKHMSDGQLLQVANEGGLIEEAQQALAQELHRRSLKLSDLPHHKESPQEALQNEARERWFPLLRRFGFGLYDRNYLDESDRLHNIQLRTKFFVFGIPLIPIASYRFRCKGDPHKWFQDDSDQHVLSRVPLAWTQVFMTWTKTVLWGAAIIGSIILFQWIRYGRL